MFRTAVGIVFMLFVCAATSRAQAPAAPQAPDVPPASAAPAVLPAQPSGGAAPQGVSNRYQEPELGGFLSRTYFSLQLGAIDYRFSNEQLEPGFTSDEVLISHGAVRLVLMGFRFTKYLSGQVSYGRPVQYVRYTNVNGTGQTRAVSVAIGEVTMKTQIPFTQKTSIYGEFGVNETTRKGFSIEGDTIVGDTHVASIVAGGGLEYHVNNRWDLLAGVSYASGHPRHRQPETVFFSTGFRYNMRSVAGTGATSDEYFFAKQALQVGYTTKALGYSVNNLVSSKVPIFWGGDVPVSSGGVVRYQRTTFHSRKIFSFDLGASAGVWAGDGTGKRFTTVSGYPLLRFTLLRRNAADVYLSYSAAGPTFITKTSVDGQSTGTHFTFQDMLGAGAYLTRNRNLLLEFNIAHYSNGNLFFQNPGIKIPLTLSLGYVF